MAFGMSPRYKRQIPSSTPRLSTLTGNSSNLAPGPPLLSSSSRLSVRAPLPLPKPFKRAALPPSIPVSDQAWGYEENADGFLELQQPPPFPPNSHCGPGTYSPNSIDLPSAPAINFAAGPGRGAPLVGFTDDMSWCQPSASDAAAGAEDGEAEEPPDDGPTIVPPRSHLPIAANLRRTSPRYYAKPLMPAPPTPGPGAYDSSAMGEAWRHYERLPKQQRYHARVNAVLPLSPRQKDRVRVKARSPRSLEPLITVHRFEREEPNRDRQRPVFFARPPLPPPKEGSGRCKVDYSNIPEGGYDIDAILAEAEEQRRQMEERYSKGHDSRGEAVLIMDEFEAATARQPPRPLTSEAENLLWRSFCTADADGNGYLSRRELFAALDEQGALQGRSKYWADAFKTVDADDNSFVEWEEFCKLGKKHPEIGDLMRSISWADRRSQVINEATERVIYKAPSAAPAASRAESRGVSTRGSSLTYQSLV